MSPGLLQATPIYLYASELGLTRAGVRMQDVAACHCCMLALHHVVGCCVWRTRVLQVILCPLACAEHCAGRRCVE
jgi:hypothetical protein